MKMFTDLATFHVQNKSEMGKSIEQQLLPQIAHGDHTNYIRWGVVYAAGISQLDIFYQRSTNNSWMATSL